MCGCSNFVNNDEKVFETQDEFNREFDFTGNRPSVIEVGENWEDPTFDFTGNRPSVIEIGEKSMFDFMTDTESKPEFFEFGGKGKARRDLREQGLSRKDARDVVRGKKTLPSDQTKSGEIDPITGLPIEDTDKTIYGQGDWFSRNLVWIVLGVGVVGVGYYIYKKRK